MFHFDDIISITDQELKWFSLSLTGGTFDCTLQPVKILKLLLEETFLYQRVLERLGSECLGCNQANGIIFLFKDARVMRKGNCILS